MGLILPTPPNDEEKYLYIKSNAMIFYCFNAVTVTALLLGSWLFTLSHAAFYFYAVVGVLSFIYLGLSVLVGLFGKDFDLKEHQAQLGQDFFPSVDVFLPCCGEDIEIIKNTHKYVKKLDWPNLNVYVLDDGASTEVLQSALDNGFVYFSRPNRGEHKKAGNLRYAFERSGGDFILILDADFCPRPDFIKEVIGHFKDPKVAILQTPQFFRIHEEQSWIEKGAAFVQEVFYRLIQVKRNSFGAAICVGTCAMYRREALEPFGGTALIDHSEDVHTGVNAMSLGYKVKYVPINLSCGVCPDQAVSFFNQQYRWAMGSISLFLHSEIFWKTPMTIMQRLCYTTGLFYYLTTAVVIFLQPLPPIFLLVIKPELLHLYNFFFSIPSLIFGTVFMWLWNHAQFGTYALQIRTISSYSHLFAWIDGLLGKKMAWIPSGTRKKNARFKKFLTIIYWWNLFIVASVFLLSGYRIHDVGIVNLAPVLFLTLLNYWASTAGFFKET